MEPKADAKTALRTPTDLDPKKTKAIAEALNAIIADTFALYVKTKNFHWHMSGPNFRDYHLLLDDQGESIYASIDPLAERVRKLGRQTLTSIGQINKLKRLKDNDAEYVDPVDMLVELMEDNKATAKSMREAHKICDDAEDSGTAGLLETFIDETEKRTWFLYECARAADSTGH
jgi:starvation-inducible DNA-binding protein